MGKYKENRRERGIGGVQLRSDGRWAGSFVAGKNSEGKKIVRWVYAKTEAECKKKLKALREELGKSDYVHVQKSTVKEYMQDWLVSVKKNELKPKSYDRLEQTLDLYVYPGIGQLQLSAVQSSDVQKMINDMRDKKFSHSTIKKAYDAVNACFKLGVIQKTVATNPALGVSVPAKKSFPQTKIHFYTEEEARLLSDQSQKKYKNGNRIYPLGSFVPLLINTGLRMGELLALRWEEDVDLKQKTLTVHNNVAFVKNRENEEVKGHKLIVQDSVKTNAGQDRTIPLNEAAVAALEDLKAVTGSQKYVMSTRNGTIVSPRNADRIFRRICVAAGFPEEKVYGLHALRHTFATLLLKNNIDIKMVSELLGHSDVSITYNTYIHFIKEQKASAVAALPNFISEKPVTANQQEKSEGNKEEESAS